MRPSSLCPVASNTSSYQQAREIIKSIQDTDSNPYVEVIIRYHDPRQDWIDKRYACAREDERRKTITIKHCKDATFIMGFAQCASAAPRHGDRYDQHTGIAVAYAKLCHEEIPDYI